MIGPAPTPEMATGGAGGTGHTAQNNSSAKIAGYVAMLERGETLHG